MSLILNNTTSTQWTLPQDGQIEDLRDSSALDRYLSILEANRKSSSFVPNDALLALDMAGFVAGAINNSNPHSQVSAGRLALALMQPHQMPLQ